MATAPKFRIDVDIHNLLMDSSREMVKPAAVKGLTLSEPVLPRYPEKLLDPGPEIAPEKRDWSLSHFYRHAGMAFSLSAIARAARRIPSHHRNLFVECKCNLDCRYCWATTTKRRA